MKEHWPALADSRSFLKLREPIERAAEERELRRMCDEDLPQIERLLRFWRSHGKPELYLRIVR